MATSKATYVNWFIAAWNTAGGDLLNSNVAFTLQAAFSTFMQLELECHELKNVLRQRKEAAIRGIFNIFAR